MKNNNSYYIKLIGLVGLFSLFATISKAQQPERIITIDTSDLSIYWDSSQIRLNKAIAEKDYWFDILKNDTTLISFFKHKANNKPYYIYIASIDRIVGSSYEFMIYSRPVTVSTKELLDFGYATYHVSLIPQLNGKLIIGEIKFNGIVI